ncbi:MAG: GatB/YqeY domain-containing protein, partial [Nitrosopumilus sp.]|nr:GatB/YqeY domain-containing protein [Nitrosopumilus sp.]
DTVRLNVMRGISSAFTNELVAKGQKPQDELADDAGIAVIKRLVKQRKDSIEQFTKGGREDLAADEKTELAVLETLLPASMPKEEIKKVAEAKKAELGITDKAKLGMLIGAVNKELKGAADGGDIKEVVESLFA